jgi:hypothetical protein
LNPGAVQSLHVVRLLTSPFRTCHTTAWNDRSVLRSNIPISSLYHHRVPIYHSTKKGLPSWKAFRYSINAFPIGTTNLGNMCTRLAVLYEKRLRSFLLQIYYSKKTKVK